MYANRVLLLDSRGEARPPSQTEINKMSIIKSEVNLLTRKDVAAEVKPVFGYRGFERFVRGYVATGYGFSSEVFPRRGMAESFIKAFFRGGKQ